jgi:hypothetical protein
MPAVARPRPLRFQAPALLQLDETAMTGAPALRCLLSVDGERFRVQRLDVDARPTLLDVPRERVACSKAASAGTSVIVALGGVPLRIELDDPATARELRRAFVVEDIGGDGPLTPPGRRHANYLNTPSDPELSPGTFVWRPAREHYFHERPDEFDLPGRLYHPVKAGVAAWEETRA